MYSSFSIHRFYLVLRAHLSEHIRSYLLGIGVLVGLWIMLLTPSTLRTVHFGESLYRMHGILFCFLLGGTGALFASETFRVVSNPLRGIPYLMLPASRLEKFMVNLLMLILYVLVYVGVFYAVEGICFTLINSRLPLNEPRYQLLDLTGPHLPPDLLYLSWLAPSFFLLGSIYFPKNALVKSGVIAFLLFFFFSFLNEFLIIQQFPAREHYGTTPFLDVFFFQSGRSYSIQLAGFPRLIIQAILLLLTPALWFTAYLRFKEKQL